MKISQLYTYPIKSLRPTPVSHAVLTRQGFPYDRRFMLLKVVQEKGGGRGGGGDGDGDDDDNKTETLKNMHLSQFPEMTLFLTDLVFPNRDKDEDEDEDEYAREGKIVVTYHPPRISSSSSSSPLSQNQNQDQNDTTINDNNRSKTLEIPLTPSTNSNLKELNIMMHRSPTKAYDMGQPYNDWFSDCFGYRVVLAYLGDNSRAVLGSLSPGSESKSGSQQQKQQQSSWISFGSNLGSGLTSWFWNNIINNSNDTTTDQGKITFADCAPYLIVSETSVHDVTARIRSGEGKNSNTTCSTDEEQEEMDITKFRPNIVISGASTAYEEDFWAELSISNNKNSNNKDVSSKSSSSSSSSSFTLLLTANCVRCLSLNIDYNTGNYGKGPWGSVLKKLMKDRRVDKGTQRYSPVFGRYGFLGSTNSSTSNSTGGSGSGRGHVEVGDEVIVSRFAKERSVNDWPF